MPVAVQARAPATAAFTAPWVKRATPDGGCRVVEQRGLGKRHGTRYRHFMEIYLPALMLLSGSAFIHSRSNVPELRPSSEGADLFWRLLGKLAFFLWIGMLIWGVYMRPLHHVALGFGLSLLFNVFLIIRGPKPFWPALSMLMGVLGVGLSVYLILGPGAELGAG